MRSRHSDPCVTYVHTDWQGWWSLIQRTSLQNQKVQKPNLVPIPERNQSILRRSSYKRSHDIDPQMWPFSSRWSKLITPFTKTIPKYTVGARTLPLMIENGIYSACLKPFKYAVRSKTCTNPFVLSDSKLDTRHKTEKAPDPHETAPPFSRTELYLLHMTRSGSRRSLAFGRRSLCSGQFSFLQVRKTERIKHHWCSRGWPTQWQGPFSTRQHFSTFIGSRNQTHTRTWCCFRLLRSRYGQQKTVCQTVNANK